MDDQLTGGAAPRRDSRPKMSAVTSHAPGLAAADRPRPGSAGPPAGSVTDNDRRRQTTNTSEQNSTGPLDGPVIT